MYVHFIAGIGLDQLVLRIQMGCVPEWHNTLNSCAQQLRQLLSGNLSYGSFMNWQMDERMPEVQWVHTRNQYHC
jgi:hypothetical protein